MKLKKSLSNNAIFKFLSSIRGGHFWPDLNCEDFMAPIELLDNIDDITRVEDAIKVINEYKTLLERS